MTTSIHNNSDNIYLSIYLSFRMIYSTASSFLLCFDLPWFHLIVACFLEDASKLQFPIIYRQTVASIVSTDQQQLFVSFSIPCNGPDVTLCMTTFIHSALFSLELHLFFVRLSFSVFITKTNTFRPICHIRMMLSLCLVVSSRCYLFLLFRCCRYRLHGYGEHSLFLLWFIPLLILFCFFVLSFLPTRGWFLKVIVIIVDVLWIMVYRNCRREKAKKRVTLKVIVGLKLDLLYS